MSCYSDIIQPSKLDIHTNTLPLAHMDSFWFAKLSVALIRMMFMPYHVYVAVDIGKVAVFHTGIQHYFWLTALKRELKANQGSTCSKEFGRLRAPQVKVNHYCWEKQKWDNISWELDPAQSYSQSYSSLFPNIKRKSEGVVENRHCFSVGSFLCPGPFVWNSGLFLSRETVNNWKSDRNTNTMQKNG